MQKGLAESADVRKLAISLKATEYGGELTGKLLAVSKELENLYEGYIDLKARKVVDEKLYQKQLDVLNVKFKFTEKAKAVRTKKQDSLVWVSCFGALRFFKARIGKNMKFTTCTMLVHNILQAIITTSVVCSLNNDQTPSFAGCCKVFAERTDPQVSPAQG